MEFFVYHRDRAGSKAMREQLVETHWSYMDGYATEMIARGPVFDSGDGAALGSVHILDLPDSAAARAFAFNEPYYQAGVYRDVMVRRWRNLLGRTMWQFPPGYTAANRFLVLGLGTGPAVDTAVPRDPDTLIAYGPLLSDDGTAWLGTMALVQAPNPAAARTVLTAGQYIDIEVRAWDFGGRPE